MSEDVANPGLVRPPFVYLTAIVVGVLLQVVVPLPFVPAGVATPLGVLLIALAVGLFVEAKRRFDAAGTPVPGDRPATAIVRQGPYRFTRNPIYMAFSLLHLGVAVWVDSVWLLATLVVALGVMATVV